MVPGVAGAVLTATANDCAAEVPQLLLAETETFPPVEPAKAVMELVVEEPVQPLGNIHVYDVAPVTVVILYMFELPEQMLVLPLMAPGLEGTGVTVTDNVWAEDEPQVLFADTVTFPLVVLAVAVMEVDVEEPVQPPGSVQVYDAAPVTEVML